MPVAQGQRTHTEGQDPAKSNGHQRDKHHREDAPERGAVAGAQLGSDHGRRPHHTDSSGTCCGHIRSGHRGGGMARRSGASEIARKQRSPPPTRCKRNASPTIPTSAQVKRQLTVIADGGAAVYVQWSTARSGHERFHAGTYRAGNVIPKTQFTVASRPRAMETLPGVPARHED